LNAAHTVAKLMKRDPVEAHARSACLPHFVDYNFPLIGYTLNAHDLLRQFAEIKWLPPKCPDGHLSQLLWFRGEEELYSLKEMGLSQDSLSICGVLPILRGDCTNSELKKALGWNSPSNIQKVIQQLEVIHSFQFVYMHKLNGIRTSFHLDVPR